jgi:type I restriction enzyme S subunit
MINDCRYGPPIFQILRGIEGAYNVALMKAIPKENITNDFFIIFCVKKNFSITNALSPRTSLVFWPKGVDVLMLN